MQADTYDAFLLDMSDYVWRVFIPRMYGNLKALSQLPPLISFRTGLSLLGGMPLSSLQLNTPDQVKSQAKVLIDILDKNGGERGIRTLGAAINDTHDFQSCSFGQLGHLSVLKHRSITLPGQHAG